jgi:opacity protein-like surface antigen
MILRPFILKAIVVFTFMATVLPICSFAQANPSAYVQQHTLSIGGEYSLWNSDFFGNNLSLNRSAFTIYGDYLVYNSAWPVSLEVNYSRIMDHDQDNRQMSSFLFGPQVSHHYGRFEPFAKVLGGFGHLNANDVLTYQQDGDHFAIGLGGGMDYRLTNRITLRPVDFTYERWNFTPHALSPYMVGFGLSYRIH